MRRLTHLLAGTCFAVLAATPAFAQDTAPGQDEAQSSPGQPETIADPAPEGEGEIVVTARRREETLQDVPVAITAVSGDLIEQRGIANVRELAAQVPGLNINSDGSGRAFVAIRGVGVTLVQSVQPGVGIFVDGIYRPNTAYLNNPLLDVQRVEVLRGPQGTLYGKNTLGGAINIITRTPGNEVEVRGVASYAFPDDAWLVSGSLTLPIVTDQLAIRIGGSHREQNGFIRNTTLNADQNYLNTDSVSGTIRWTPGDAVVTINGYYDAIDGTNIPYTQVTGPTDYRRTIGLNALNRTSYDYYGVNARLQLPLDGLNSNLTLMGAYDGRDTFSPDSDGDFGPVDFVRSEGQDSLETITTELRLDSELSDTFSTLFGLFYSRETTDATNIVRIPAAGVVNTAVSATEADTYAVFGTLFWKPNDLWEIALGLRYDHEDRNATGGAVVGGVVQPIQPANITSDEVQPRLSVTRHWTPNFMSYASVARGYRGGGFNSPLAPVRTYKGDSAWTYELGSRYSSDDRRFSLSGAVYYSDYRDYIGLNSVAPAAGTLVTVDLNSGDVESYGAEAEATFRPTENWTISGSFSYTHARFTDTTAYETITKRTLSSDRLTFQPDVTFSINSDYRIPIGDDSLTLSVGATHKGERLAATLNQTTPTFLDAYTLVNAQITYAHGPLEFSLFANNAFNEDYFESYIERTTLDLALPPFLPRADLGIIGDRGRYGARVRFSF